MKYSLLFLALVYSQLSCARTISQNEAKIFATDESCEIKASFITFNNAPVIMVKLESSEQVSYRQLTMKIMDSEREVYQTTDDQLPTMEVRMPLKHESGQPLLSVFYSGRYFSCAMKNDDESFI